MVVFSAGVSAGDYNRSDWPHWKDLDGDCQNTRAESLISTSSVEVVFDGCKVISGAWVGPYTGKEFTIARNMDIDHIVPLAEAHDSGAENWTKAQRKAFANDPENLIPTDASANRSKGKKDPGVWMPPLESYHCEYAARWWMVKAKYQLTMDANEQLAIMRILGGC